MKSRITINEHALQFRKKKKNVDFKEGQIRIRMTPPTIKNNNNVAVKSMFLNLEHVICVFYMRSILSKWFRNS